DGPRTPVEHRLDRLMHELNGRCLPIIEDAARDDVIERLIRIVLVHMQRPDIESRLGEALSRSLDHRRSDIDALIAHDASLFAEPFVEVAHAAAYVEHAGIRYRANL